MKPQSHLGVEHKVMSLLYHEASKESCPHGVPSSVPALNPCQDSRAFERLRVGRRPVPVQSRILEHPPCVVRSAQVRNESVSINGCSETEHKKASINGCMAVHERVIDGCSE